MNLFHFLFLYLRGKEKESGVKKKKARHCFLRPHGESPFGRVYFSAKAESLMFAIVLRTRSQLAEHCLNTKCEFARLE